MCYKVVFSIFCVLADCPVRVQGETESLWLLWQPDLYAFEVPGPGRAEPSVYGYRSGVTAIIETELGPARVGVSVKDIIVRTCAGRTLM